MGWFSDLFNRKPYGPDIAFNCNVPMPSVKPPKPEKDISQPVHAIVKAMKERPSSFKLISTNNNFGRTFSQTEYTVKDIKTNQVLVVTFDTSFFGNFTTDYTYSWSWLTQDEGDLLRTEFLEINKKKIRRKLNIQRTAMKAIYK